MSKFQDTIAAGHSVLAEGIQKNVTQKLGQFSSSEAKIAKVFYFCDQWWDVDDGDDADVDGADGDDWIKKLII